MFPVFSVYEYISEGSLMLTAASVPELDLGSHPNNMFHELENAMLRAGRQFKHYCCCEAVRVFLRLLGGDMVGVVIAVASALNHLTAALLIATGTNRFTKIQTTSGIMCCLAMASIHSGAT